MRAFLYHFAFELRTGTRNKTLLLLNYLFPLGFYLLMGAIMPSLYPPFRANIIPAMVMFAVLSATLLGIPDPLVNARENGIFRSFRINGVPTFSILVIPALATILHLAVVTVVILVSAPLLFKAPMPSNWGLFVLVWAAATLACAGLSVLIGVVSPSSRQTVLWAQAVYVPSMLLGGLMLPLAMLPAAAGKAALLLPAAQAMNAWQALAFSQPVTIDPWISVLALYAGGALAFMLAVYLFSWDRHNTSRHKHPLLGILALMPYVVVTLWAVFRVNL